MPRRHILSSAALIVLALLAFVWAWPLLPQEVPIHWNHRGDVDGLAARWVLLMLGPGLMTGFVLLFIALPWLSPAKYAIEPFAATAGHLMFVLVALHGFFYALLLAVAIGLPIDTSRAMGFGAALLIGVVGNVMGKVKPNFYIGIRTPWTLANARVWHATHRFAAKAMVAGAAAGAVALLLPLHTPLALGLGLALPLLGALLPVFYSLWLYKRWQRQGLLEAA
jgi:uncharacterized membrane protein